MDLTLLCLLFVRDLPYILPSCFVSLFISSPCMLVLVFAHCSTSVHCSLSVPCLLLLNVLFLLFVVQCISRGTEDCSERDARHAQHTVQQHMHALCIG